MTQRLGKKRLPGGPNSSSLFVDSDLAQSNLEALVLMGLFVANLTKFLTNELRITAAIAKN